MAVLLYGETDPERIMATGLHGLGGRPTRIALTQDGPCRFTLATAHQTETIDFDRISAIRFADMADPASGLAGTARGSPGGEVRHLGLTILEGTDAAICSASGCMSRRAFALVDPERIKAARAASGVLSEICPSGAPNRRDGPG